MQNVEEMDILKNFAYKHLPQYGDPLDVYVPMVVEELSTQDCVVNAYVADIIK